LQKTIVDTNLFELRSSFLICFGMAERWQP